MVGIGPLNKKGLRLIVNSLFLLFLSQVGIGPLNKKGLRHNNILIAKFNPFILVGIGPLNKKGLRPSPSIIVKAFFKEVGIGPLNKKGLRLR